MEYYIMKKFEEEFKKWKPEKRNEKCTFRSILSVAMREMCYVELVLFVIGFLGLSICIIIEGLCPEKNNETLTTIFSLIYVVALFLLIVLCVIEWNVFWDKYESTYMYKVDLLNNILVDEYGISTEEQRNRLLNLYKERIKKLEGSQKRRYKVIGFVASGVTGAISLFLANLAVLGFSIDDWIDFVAVALAVSGTMACFMFSMEFSFSKKGNYESMVSYLEAIELQKPKAEKETQ